MVEPELILIGTGSEVHICAEAADLLEQDGIGTRVVSAPCLDRFAEQDDDYRESVLPRAVRARVSVEAATPLGWSTWIGEDGEAIGMTTFGSSAPQPDLYEHFGFTPEKVAERARGVVERPRPAPERSSDERRRRGEPEARGADGRRHQRLAGPDPPQPDHVG